MLDVRGLLMKNNYICLSNGSKSIIQYFFLKKKAVLRNTCDMWRAVPRSLAPDGGGSRWLARAHHHLDQHQAYTDSTGVS